MIACTSGAKKNCGGVLAPGVRSPSQIPSPPLRKARLTHIVDPEQYNLPPTSPPRHTYGYVTYIMPVYNIWYSIYQVPGIYKYTYI